MGIIHIEDLLKHVNNRYELVNLAKKRCKQLMDGASPLINNINGKKVTLIALEEIKEEKVIPKSEEEDIEKKTKKQKKKTDNK